LIRAALKKVETPAKEGRVFVFLQPLAAELAYQGEIGRETTAEAVDRVAMERAYQGEIGRETTASGSAPERAR